MANLRISRIEGVVASQIDDTWFTVRLGDGRALAARVSRRLGLLQKQHTVGDRVLVGMLARAADGLILTRGSRVTP
jgi:translation initiation factor IF-1